MSSWLAWLIAILSTAAFLVLWFREVRRLMLERKSTVESAAGQLAACREKAAQANGDPDAAAILARSESIYQQAVDIYKQTMCKPWIYLPARLMGFQQIWCNREGDSSDDD